MLQPESLPTLSWQGKTQIELANWIANGGLRLRRSMIEGLFAKVLNLLDHK